jgi:multiple sugar transport system permease protein
MRMSTPSKPKGRGALKRMTPLQCLGVLALCAVAALYLYPLFWLLDSSFRPAVDIFRFPPLLFDEPLKAVKGYTLDSFRALAGIALTLLVCSLCAYAFAFLEFPGKKALFFLILGTMMLPTTTMIVPYYKVIRGLGLSDNLLGLILPYAVSAFGVFMLRQFYIKIPRSFIESARVEGAGHLRIWWSIILPISRPALAALAIVQFRQIWNDFLNPMIILRSESLFTLPVRIQVMDSQNFNKPYDAIITAGFITALVPMIVFLLFQRQFVEGLAGGLKE